MIWEGVRGPKKMIMGRAGWLDRPFHEHHDDLLRWFDHWLKGEENGVMDEAPIRLFVNGLGRYRDEQEWPLARTRWTDFHLRTFGRLSPAPERHAGLPPDGYVQQPLSVTKELGGLRYGTGPLPDDLELTGPLAFYLHAAIDDTDSWFKVTLLDLDPNGGAREVTHGHLRCSHRTLDEERSRPWQPFHDHTEGAVSPVTPGEVLEYAIELYPVSHVFRRGHQMAVHISSGDLPGAQFSYHTMRANTVAYRVFRDAAHPSRLHAPVIPNDETRRTA
jgi:predicted acyl esterase